MNSFLATSKSRCSLARRGGYRLLAIARRQQQDVEAATSGSGYATFELAGRLDRGDYYLFIDGVQLTDHIWNYTRGLRHGSITVK